MPWDIILASLGSSSLTAIIIVVLGLTLAQKFMEQRLTNATRHFESSLIKAEEAYRKAVDLNAQIDIHLREQRVKVYAIIWQETGILPRWPRATDVKYADILEFSQNLRSWYFNEQGGMWLSTTARKAYGNLQEANTRILAKRAEGVIEREDYDTILAKCSTLRTELTNDLVSRRAAPSDL
jgi:hypothetical protein